MNEQFESIMLETIYCVVSQKGACKDYEFSSKRVDSL